MPIPHRVFTDFHHISAHGYGASNFNTYDKWLNDHVTEATIGLKKIDSGGTVWERYDLFYKGTEEQGWGEIDGADAVMSVCLVCVFLPPFYNSGPVTELDSIIRGCLYRNADDWDVEKGTGRYTDGVSAQYFAYPHDYHAGDVTNNGLYSDIAISSFPAQWDIWHEAWNAFGNDALAYKQSSYILTRGMFLAGNTYAPATIDWGAGDGVFLNVDLHYATIKYFNPMVNSFSRYSGPTAGGFPLVLYGLGLHNDDDEIDEGGQSRVADGGGSWNDCVDYIYVEDLDGNVVSALQVDLDGVPGGRDFSRGSNTEITIYSFPALAAGTYQLRLRKAMSLAPITNVDSYAGDWRCDAGGRMEEGRRLYISIGDPVRHPYVPLVCLRWKKGDSYEETCYAPIDTRARLRFYEGLLLGMSSFKRGTSDITGSPVFPDIDLELDNTERTFSKLLAEYWIKNQVVEAYISFGDEAEADRVMVFGGFVSDYDKPTSRWRVKLRNVLGKYFEAKVPRYRVTEEEYPDAHPNYLGKEIPELLGRGVLDTGSMKGAAEAICVDTTAYKYLASMGSLHAILNVYSNDDPIDPADYAVSWEDGGRTYITFDSDQGDNKVTFDFEGYMYGPWNDTDSGGEYVRNPAYVILYFLEFLVGIPEELIDVDSFEAMAAAYEAAGRGQSAYLIVQDEKGADAVLQELLFSYGAKCWESAGGKITIGRKDPGDLASVAHLFQQIDALDEAQKPIDFSAAVNRAPIGWAFYPSANICAYSGEAVRQVAVDAFGAYIEPSSPWDYLWTDDAGLAAARAEEDLLKLSFGDQRIILPLSIRHYRSLDILDTFRFQDPYGISLDGSGDYGRYWYVEGLTIDPLEGKMTVEGVDLQWLLRQYCVLGDEDARASNWSAATETDRMYCYLCSEATDLFADGEPGKKLISENQ